jgi:exodeoxyribonuclease-1
MADPSYRWSEYKSDLVFYDTENTDLNPKHGQITQFGGLRTNDQLETIDKIDTHVRLLPWVIPMPAACRVTGVPPWELSGPDRISEFQAAKAINTFLYPGNHKSRTFVTYNGSRHDDECIRYMLFRNLLNPWFNSGKTSKKIDLFPLVQLIHAADPGIIKIPTLEDGKLSYKLDRICPENEIDIVAHDALGDTYAMVDLTRLILQRAPWAWNQAQSNGNFLNVETSISTSVREVKPLWLFTHFGAPKFSPVLPLCHDGKNRHLVLDLNAQEFQRNFDETPGEKIVSKDSPFHYLKTKSIPMIVNEDVVRRAGISFDAGQLEEKMSKILADTDMLRSVDRAMRAQSYEDPAHPTSEEQIFGGFVDNATKSTMNEFVNARTWEERLAKRFAGDNRIREFAARIFLEADIYGDVTLKDNFRTDLQAICERTIMRPYGDKDARWSTITHALEEQPDRAWTEWAIKHFGDDARLLQHLEGLPVDITTTPAAEPAPPEAKLPDPVEVAVVPRASQMSFGF